MKRIKVASFFTVRGLVFRATLVLVVLSTALHWPAFTKDLQSTHVWRQSLTQNNIDNFYEEDFRILNPRQNDRGSGDGIRRLEFPLMQWLFAATYRLLAPSIMLSRTLSFLLGLLTLLGMYRLVAYLFSDPWRGFIAMWALAFSPTFFYYAVCPLPDNMALTFGTWGLYCFVRWQRENALTQFVLAGILLSISALVKLPFVLYFALPFATHLVRWWQDRGSRQWRHLLGWGAFLLPPTLWYGYSLPDLRGNGVVSGILLGAVDYQQYWRDLVGNLVSVLPELLLNYGSVPFFLTGAWLAIGRFRRNPGQILPWLCTLLALVALVLYELNLLGTHHDYYFFPFLPPVFIVVAQGAYFWLQSARPGAVLMAVILLLSLPLFAHLRIHTRWQPAPDKLGFNPDLQRCKTLLREAVPDGALCVVGNDVSHHIFFYYIHKKGWAFHGDALEAEQLRVMITEGARYLYSDSRAVDQAPEVKPYLDSLLLQCGSIAVYRLREAAASETD